jgi:hypothetical protein
LRFLGFSISASDRRTSGDYYGAAIVIGRQLATLRRHISTGQIESFRIADKLQAAVLNLNATLLRFVVDHSLEDCQEFAFACDSLQAWLGQPGQQSLSTARERQELAEVRPRLAAYQTEARTIE